MIDDLRYALRGMRRSPGFTAAALLMIALGTGANAAMYSVIEAVLLHSPFVDADRLAMLSVERPDRKTTAALTMEQYRGLFASATPFEAIGAMGGGNRPTLSGMGELRKVNVECVTAGMFAVLGTPPLLGRTFTADEDRPGGPPAVVLGHDFWKRQFGGSADVVGRSMALNGIATTIVGVMPRNFLGPLSRNNTEAWLPFGPALGGVRGIGCGARAALWPTVNAFVKVRRGVTFDVAAAQTGLRLEPLTEHALYDFRTELLVLLAAVGVVLLIACVNVANLQLERIFARRHEHAVRIVLGASRARIVRQALVETFLLYVAGTAVGVLLAAWTLRVMIGVIPPTLPHVQEIQLDARVLAATFAIAALSGLLVGLWPARQAASSALADPLRASSRTSTGAASWARGVMVSAQIALSLTLLVAAALLARTLLILLPSDPGLRVHDKLTGMVRLEGAAAAGSRPLTFLEAVVERIAREPGVLGVAATTYVPMSGNVSTVDVNAGDLHGSAWSGSVTPNFFDELRVPIVRGRGFDARDRAGSAPVAVVNEAFARKAWPGRDALGATLTMTNFDGTAEAREVIGIVRDFRSSAGDTRMRPELYTPFAQNAVGFINFLVRGGDASDRRLRDALVSAVAAVDSSQVVDRIATYDEVLAGRTATWRFGAWLLGVFAALAVTLAAIGLASSIAWWVSRRTREIGVRMALGAHPRQVTRMFLRQASLLSVGGVLLGVGAAAASTRLLQSWLYGVTPLDPATFACASAGMLAVAAAASYIPARRAARVDPLIALRAE